MNVIEGQRACARFRPLLDSYISNELLVETTHDVMRHLEGCADCRQETAGIDQVRFLLRDAVSRLEVPGRLRSAALRQTLREEGPRQQDARPRKGLDAVSPWMAIAAGLLVAIAGGMAVQSGMHYRDQRASVLEVGWRQHEHCVLGEQFRAALPARDVVERELGDSYRWLLAASEQQLDGHTIRDAHICRSDGRRFAHVVAEKDKRLVSVSVMPEEGADRIQRPWWTASERLGATRHAQGSAAGFTAQGMVVFVMGDRPVQELENLASGLRPALPQRH